MAVDTKEKRLSIAALALTIVPQLVTPNASQDAEWREEVAWLYSGIALDAPSAAPAVNAPVVAVGRFEPSGGAGVLEPQVGVGRFEPSGGAARA